MVKKFTPPIKYTDRDFQSIKQSLIDYAKKYYPNTAADFNEASFGSLMFDMVSYVGDIMSFYVDYQASESFIDSAVEFNNVSRLARQMGYKQQGDVTAEGTVALFIKVPANASGLGPDTNYIPVLKKNTKLSTDEDNISFLLTEDVDFNSPDVQTIVSDVDSDSGIPLFYALKAYGNVISGDYGVHTFSVGEFKPYSRFLLDTPDVAEIITVFDSQGNQYFEVDYLSQDIVYQSIENRENDKNLVPRIFKAISVPRRFILEREDDLNYIRFGGGSSSDAIVENDKKLDPSAVALKMYAKDYVSDSSFDPSVLVENNNLGIAPSNTTITCFYRTNLVDTINVGVNDLNRVVSPVLQFENSSTLSETTQSTVINSLEVSNEEVIVGQVNLPTVDEIKMRAKNLFATQNRAVTRNDYIALTYAMPTRFGSIKRATIMQDKDSFKRNLNLYVVSEGLDGTLKNANMKIKTNLKNWMNGYKMLNDTIDIVDASILNLAIDFKAIAETNFDKYTALQNAVDDLQDFFDRAPEIGESIYITDIYNVLNEASGIADVEDVEITVKSGGIYSNFSLNLDNYLSKDGRYIKMPQDVIYEIRFVEDDIKGVII